MKLATVVLSVLVVVLGLVAFAPGPERRLVGIASSTSGLYRAWSDGTVEQGIVRVTPNGQRVTTWEPVKNE